MKYYFKKDILCRTGKMLTEVRKGKGLSQVDVALQTDLALPTIQAIENGEAVAFRKYIKLIHFYKQRIDIRLINQ